MVDVFGIAVSLSKLTLVVEFLVMAVVLVVRPWGLLGTPQAPSRYAAPAEEPLRRRQAALRDRGCAASAVLVALPLLAAGSPYMPVLLDRPADRRAVRGQPALHHGPGRHAFVRPCRVLRPRRVRRGAAACKVLGAADGSWRCVLAPLLAGARRAACSAGSACGCPASISRCSRSRSRRSSGRSCSSGTSVTGGSNGLARRLAGAVAGRQARPTTT